MNKPSQRRIAVDGTMRPLFLTPPTLGEVTLNFAYQAKEALRSKQPAIGSVAGQPRTNALDPASPIPLFLTHPALGISSQETLGNSREGSNVGFQRNDEFDLTTQPPGGWTGGHSGSVSKMSQTAAGEPSARQSSIDLGMSDAEVIRSMSARAIDVGPSRAVSLPLEGSLDDGGILREGHTTRCVCFVKIDVIWSWQALLTDETYGPDVIDVARAALGKRAAFERRFVNPLDNSPMGLSESDVALSDGFDPNMPVDQGGRTRRVIMFVVRWKCDCHLDYAIQYRPDDSILDYDSTTTPPTVTIRAPGGEVKSGGLGPGRSVQRLMGRYWIDDDQNSVQGNQVWHLRPSSGPCMVVWADAPSYSSNFLIAATASKLGCLPDRKFAYVTWKEGLPTTRTMSAR